MQEQLYELLRLLNKKHPGNRHDGFVKLYMYADGSGMILDGPLNEGNILLDFDDPDELVAHLLTPDVEEPEHKEEQKG